jgi:hypothetical protein
LRALSSLFLLARTLTTLLSAARLLMSAAGLLSTTELLTALFAGLLAALFTSGLLAALSSTCALATELRLLSRFLPVLFLLFLRMLQRFLVFLLLMFAWLEFFSHVKPPLVSLLNVGW